MAQKGKKPGQENAWGKQEDPLQAVVIADSFNERFLPVTKEIPRVLLPLVNKRILDYTLEYLIFEGVQEILIFCCAHSDQIKKHIKTHWSLLPSQCTITTVTSSSTDCISLGDALREIDREGLIRSDFILVPGDTVSNVKLHNIIQQHKERRKKEKTCMMTLLYRRADPGHFSRCHEDDVVLAVDKNTKRILYCQKSKGTQNFHIPLGLFTERDSLQIRYDLSDTHICICSPMVPALFTDNFDYQTKEDFMRGILINEEIMGNQLHSYVIEDEYSARVADLHLYNAISLDILKRWAYPLVPDNGPYSFTRHNIYTGESVRLDRDIALDQNVAIGKGSVVESGSFLTNSVIGNGCTISKGVKISDSYIWDDVSIGEDCVIEGSLICSGCILKRNVKITDSIASYKVVIGPDSVVPAGTKISLVKQESFEDNFENLEIADGDTKPLKHDILGSEGRGYLWQDDEEEDVIPCLKGDYLTDSDEESDDESIPSITASPPAEPANQFFIEVLENIRHGILDKVTPENIILEVNASKYKYNVTIKEINQSVVKSMVEAAVGDHEMSNKECLGQFQKIMSDFKPLLMNYIRGDESQLHCILALEEYFAENQQKSILFPTILHKFYEEDVLEENMILDWFKKPTQVENPALQQRCEALRSNQSLQKFIQWLVETEEETDSDDSS